MTGEEIKEKIAFNNSEISKIIDPSTFVLNKKIKALMDDNKNLQEQCVHNFDENGFCIYCSKKEN